MGLLTTAVLLASCTARTSPCPTGCPTDDDTGVDEIDDEDLAESWGPTAPDWSADDAVSHLETALEGGIPTPTTLRDAYESLMVQRDSDCPRMEVQNSETWVGVWSDDCTATSGVSYYGTALYFEELEIAPAEPDYEVWSVGMLASFELTSAEGNTYVGGGGFTSLRGTDTATGHAEWNITLGGSYVYPGYPGWLSDGIETGLFMDGLDDGSDWKLSVDGGYGVSAADVYFEGLVAASDTCDGLPQGAVSVRDPTGHWFELELADCSACGELTWRGASQGEVCVGEQIGSALLVLHAEMLGE